MTDESVSVEREPRSAGRMVTSGWVAVVLSLMAGAFATGVYFGKSGDRQIRVESATALLEKASSLDHSDPQYRELLEVAEVAAPAGHELRAFARRKLEGLKRKAQLVAELEALQEKLDEALEEAARSAEPEQVAAQEAVIDLERLKNDKSRELRSVERTLLVPLGF